MFNINNRLKIFDSQYKARIALIYFDNYYVKELQEVLDKTGK